MSELVPTIAIAWVWKRHPGGYAARCIHLQGDEFKALCGTAYGPDWHFEITRNVNAFDCDRCIKSWEKARRKPVKKGSGNLLESGEKAVQESSPSKV